MTTFWRTVVRKVAEQKVAPVQLLMNDQNDQAERSTMHGRRSAKNGTAPADSAAPQCTIKARKQRRWLRYRAHYATDL